MSRKPAKIKKRLVYEVALGGIAAGMALLLVWLSVLIRYGTIGFYVAACCALIVPLSQKYYFASIGAYIASSVLAFLIVGDIFMISGYVVYFAPMTLISSFMFEKNVKPYISYPIKIVFINLALAFLFFVASNIMISSEIIGEVPFWAVAIVGTVGLLAIDFVMQRVYKVLKMRLTGVLQKKQEQTAKEEEIRENPFQDEDYYGFELSDEPNNKNEPPFDGENLESEDLKPSVDNTKSNFDNIENFDDAEDFFYGIDRTTTKNEDEDDKEN